MTVVEALRQEMEERQIDWLFEFDVLETSTVVKRKGLRRESGTADL